MPFFENAIHLDTYLITEYPGVKALADDLFQDIIKKDQRRVKTKNEEYHSKGTLKIILINLIIANDMAVAVRYSRRPASYSNYSRYKKLFFKKERVLSVIDALVELGYIDNYMGYYNREEKVLRQSRMAASENLCRLFEQYNIFGMDYIGVSPPKSEDLVILRDDKGNDMEFEDRDKKLREKITDDLARYNKFISEHEVSFNLAPDTPVNVYFLNNMLKRLINKGLVRITDFQAGEFIKYEMKGDEVHLFKMGDEEYLLMNGPGSEELKHSILKSNKYKISHYRNYYNKYINNKYYEYNILSNNNTKYNSNKHISITGTEIDLLEEYQLLDTEGTTTVNEHLIKRPLSYFGIRRLSFVSHYQYLHRVFNKYPDNAGRFYGACHINMPKEVRKCIVIDGEPACELDYKAHHIRMLYHEMEIDYRDDPYIELCREDQSLRPVYKIVSLISINAANEKEAIAGIRGGIWDNGLNFDTTGKSIKACIERFKEVHKPISNFLNSGKWGRLQYFDSKITDIILQRLLKEGVPCLPVHDSYIVPAKYEDLLAEAMIEAYKKVMYGFSPVIEKEF
ncbi:MAG: hypothetical protein GX654_21175 [Desulfatiglans sp.]|nr:hypothetical protein [Desulfatiglans sp.]